MLRLKENMLRIKEKQVSQPPTEKTKLVEEKSLLTTYGTFSLCESPFTRKQAEETARWWLNTLKNTIPEVLSWCFFVKSNYVVLTSEQDQTFINLLTDSIWAACQKPAYQKQTKYFKIAINGAHWDLVKDAMRAIPFYVNYENYIRTGIKTIMYPDEKACFVTGTQYGEIYSPDNPKVHSNQQYVFHCY